MCLQLLFLTSSPAIMGHGIVNSALTTGVTCCISLMVVSINAWAVYEAVISQVGRGQGGGAPTSCPCALHGGLHACGLGPQQMKKPRLDDLLP